MTVANEMNPEQEEEEDEEKSTVESVGEGQEKVSGPVLMCGVSNHSAHRPVADSMLKRLSDLGCPYWLALHLALNLNMIPNQRFFAG